ncbi:MAG: CRISPR-associated protein Cas4 [Anaerolineae bacterium]|nr:CRISPR-associated protein Cas4 [Anaerolineae bacterium]
MLDDTFELTVTDLKQYAYCPRVFYYHACLPDVRPTTFKMEAGIDAGERERYRSARRTFCAYQVENGERYFDVPATSVELALTGIVDEVIEVAGAHTELIPVDYKLSRRAGHHFKLQLTAYAELLEATYHVPVRRGFLYLIPQQHAEEIAITKSLRRNLRELLSAMRLVAQLERMPQSGHPARCRNCEFKRFCNDV